MAKTIVFLQRDASLFIHLLTWRHICFVFSFINDLRKGKTIE